MATHASVVVSGTGSRVELFAAIRRDARVEEFSIRELARRHGVHRRTVRQALASAEPPGRKTPTRVAPKLGPYVDAVDAMLVADLDAPRKQRHTARRVHARLVDEHDAVVSYSTVRDYVRRRRPEIAVEHGKVAVVAMVPQDHAPGVEAEVDFEAKMGYVEELLHSGALSTGDLVETVKSQQYEISQLRKENVFLKSKLAKALHQGFRP